MTNTNKKILYDFDIYLKTINADDDFFNLENKLSDFEYLKEYTEPFVEDGLEKEIISWRKFEKNKYSSKSNRVFEPKLTKGDVHDFIRNNLNLFDSVTLDWYDDNYKLVENQLLSYLSTQNPTESEFTSIVKKTYKLAKEKNSGIFIKDFNYTEDTIFDYLATPSEYTEEKLIDLIKRRIARDPDIKKYFIKGKLDYYETYLLPKNTRDVNKFIGFVKELSKEKPEVLDVFKIERNALKQISKKPKDKQVRHVFTKILNRNMGSKSNFVSAFDNTKNKLYDILDNPTKNNKSKILDIFNIAKSSEKDKVIRSIIDGEYKIVKSLFDNNDIVSGTRRLVSFTKQLKDSVSKRQMANGILKLFNAESLSGVSAMLPEGLNKTVLKIANGYFTNKFSEILLVPLQQASEMIDLVFTSTKIIKDPTTKKLFLSELSKLKEMNSTRAFGEGVGVVRNILSQFPDNTATRTIREQLVKLTGARNFEVINQSTKLLEKMGKLLPSNEQAQVKFSNGLMELITKSKHGVTHDNIFDFVQDATRTILLENKIKGNTNGTLLVDFMFDMVTDYDIRGLDGLPKFNTLKGRMQARWREFLRKAVFDVNREIRPSDLFDQVLQVFGEVKNDLLTTREVFKFNFEDSLFRAINKQLSPFDFNKRVRSQIRSSGRDIFRLALTSYGLDPKDYVQVEQVLIASLNKISGKYLNSLTSHISNGTLSVLQATFKPEKWANRTLDKMFEYGRLSADRNGLYEWVYGDTKHCPSCLYANGQKHRLKDWWKSGILPRNHGKKNIICEGFGCKCKLVRTTGKATGRLDRIPTT